MPLNVKSRQDLLSWRKLANAHLWRWRHMPLNGEDQVLPVQAALSIWSFARSRRSIGRWISCLFISFQLFANIINYCCFKSGGHAVSKSNRVHLTGSLTQTWTSQSLSSIQPIGLCFKQLSMSSVHFVGGFQLMVALPCEFWPMPLAELPEWWRSVTTLVSTAES